MKQRKNVILLGIIQCLNVFGDDFLNVAIMWIIYKQSQSTIIAGIAGVVWQLTDALAAPIAGIITDRYPKKKIILISNIIAFLCSLTLAVIVFILDDLPVQLAIFSLCIFNILTSFVTPARRSLVLHIVEKQHLDRVNGTFASIRKIASIFSSSISSFTLSLFGICFSIIMNSASYLLVVIGFLLFDWRSAMVSEIETTKASDKKSFIDDIKNGFTYIKNSKSLRAICFICIFINIVSFIGVFMSAIVFENYGDHPEFYGVIQSIATIGAIIGSLIMSSGKVDGVRFMPHIVVVMGIAIGIFGTSDAILIGSMAILSFYTLQAMLSISVETMIMKCVDRSYIGRISGLMTTISMICMPVSTMVAGVLGDIMQVQSIFIFAGIYLLFVGFIIVRLKRDLETR